MLFVQELSCAFLNSIDSNIGVPSRSIGPDGVNELISLCEVSPWCVFHTKLRPEISGVAGKNEIFFYP